MKVIPSILFASLTFLPFASAEMRPISNAILAQLEGDWEAVGYGKFLEIRGGRLREYHRNAFGCIATNDQSQQQLSKDYGYIDLVDENAFFASPLPFGDRWHFTRTTPLPYCQIRNDANPLVTFDFFDAFMKEHYAYFEERSFDWDTRSASARNTLSRSSSDQQLYNTIDSLLRELGDPHTGLYAVLNGELKHRLGVYPRHGMAMIKAAHPASPQSDDQLFLNWIINQLSALEAKMIQVGSVINTTPFYWCQFGEIGYLHIGSEGGFSSTGKLTDEVAGVEKALDRALSDLSESKALIVDLSLNLGGYQWISQLIAQRFAIESTLAHSKSMHGAAEVPPLDLILHPSERVSYHGPLYLLTSDITISAGEDLTLSLRALPQTRHYGLNTYGAQSNILPKPLPNGWGLTLSNEIYTDPEGFVWEATGIVPDFEYDFYSGGIEQSHYQRVLAFAEYVEGQLDKTPRLRIDAGRPMRTSIDQAEPGSTLALMRSSNLNDWEAIYTWTYEAPIQLEIDEELESTHQIFFKIHEVH